MDCKREDENVELQEKIGRSEGKTSHLALLQHSSSYLSKFARMLYIVGSPVPPHLAVRKSVMPAGLSEDRNPSLPSLASHRRIAVALRRRSAGGSCSLRAGQRQEEVKAEAPSRAKRLIVRQKLLLPDMSSPCLVLRKLFASPRRGYAVANMQESI
eukprot:729407-Hanusia_phi.AAC.4